MMTVSRVELGEAHQMQVVVLVLDMNTKQMKDILKTMGVGNIDDIDFDVEERISFEDLKLKLREFKIDVTIKKLLF